MKICLFPEILKLFDNTSKTFKLHENISDTEDILQFVFFTCSREEKQTRLPDTQWVIFKLTHGNEPRTSAGRTVWSIWEKIVCAAVTALGACLLVMGKARLRETLKHLCRNYIEVWKQSETISTVTPAGLWLWLHLDDAFLWNYDTDKTHTTPNKTTFHTRLSVIMIIAWFGEILTQTCKEKHWDC